MKQAIMQQPSWFERWDAQFCACLKEWHALETGNRGLVVIDVDALCDEDEIARGAALPPEDLQQARLEIYDQFRGLYREMETSDPDTPYRDTLLRRLSAFCSDIEDLVLRPEERSKQERYERRLHIPFIRLSDACFQMQAETLLEGLQLWMRETGITLDMPPENGSALEKISQFKFKRFFQKHFDLIEVGQDPANPDQLCVKDVAVLRDCIQGTMDGVQNYWDSRPDLWLGPKFMMDVNFRHTVSKKQSSEGHDAAFNAWLSGRGDKFSYTINLDLPKEDNGFKKISIIRARMEHEATHEMYHGRHLTNLWHRLKPGGRDIPDFVDTPLPRSLGLTTVRSSELMLGEFGSDGFAGLFAHTCYYGASGKPGTNSLAILEHMIFARYKWFLMMRNSRLIYTGRTYGLDAANRERREVFFLNDPDRNIEQSILPRALDWRSTHFDTYYTPVYGQMAFWSLKIMHDIGREAFERMLSDLSWQYMDAPMLLDYIKERACDLGIREAVQPSPPHWKNFVDKMQYPHS